MSNLSEEEKKAIETARCIRAGIPVGTCNDDYIYLLNLIEKQEKEIEELKKENRQLRLCNNNIYATTVDKAIIRKKIIYHKERAINIDNEFYKELHSFTAKMLEELLEESE